MIVESIIAAFQLNKSNFRNTNFFNPPLPSFSGRFHLSSAGLAGAHSAGLALVALVTVLALVIVLAGLAVGLVASFAHSDGLAVGLVADYQIAANLH